MLRTHTLFPTNIIEYQNPRAEKLNPEIISYLKEQQAESPDLPAYSSVGNTAWHSKDNLADLDTEWSKGLRQMIIDLSNRYYVALMGGTPLPSEEFLRIKCWALVLGQYSYSNFHSHPNSDISGVYWVQNPDNLQINEGRFSIPDPRGGAHATRIEGSAAWYCNPNPGSGLLFSSWVPHMVEPHYQKGERISISWNLFIKDPPPGTEMLSVASSSWRDTNGDNWG